MTGKPGRSGRPKPVSEMRAYQVRLPDEAADEFDELVRERSMAATGTPDSVSAAGVLRGLVMATLDARRK